MKIGLLSAFLFSFYYMVKLERSLGLLEVSLMSIGIILGAGVYVLIGEAAGLSGNALWISFIFAAIILFPSKILC